jgi:hypothetical protein
MIALKPYRSVTPTYHQASSDWWAGKDLYGGLGGLHYLPQFALIFSPFHSLPVPIGDIVWLFCWIVLLATGVWRLLREQFGTDIRLAFLLASLLTIPLCLASLRNGQANTMLAALALHSAACLSRRQWWTAAALIVLGLTKPLGVVLLLLSAVGYAPLRWRLVPALAALALLPFLFAPADYVMAQHRDFLANIRLCAASPEHRFADVGGILWTFGYSLPHGISKLMRVAAGGLTLWLWWKGARRLREPCRAMWLLALSSAYLMLFNPLNEINSYVIIAPALGIWAVAALNSFHTRRFGLLTALISLSMSLLPNLTHSVFGNNFALFWLPVMTIVFVGMLTFEVLRTDSPFTAVPAAGSHNQPKLLQSIHFWRMDRDRSPH